MVGHGGCAEEERHARLSEEESPAATSQDKSFSEAI